MVIRVGLVGLGREIPKAGVIGPGTWGVLAHLPSLQHLPGYHLVAVANSSIESARTAITNHKLPSEIKAYGSVSDLVKDPEVDLVVVSVRVGKHYEIAKPALLAKKNVYVEWPLAVTTSQAEELAGLARVNNLRTIVGVQARSDPLLAKVRELVSTGKIGNVVSSTVLGAFSSLPKGVGWPESAAYFLDIKSGGTAFHITFGHCEIINLS
jgi:predicted dehydrogenase